MKNAENRQCDDTPRARTAEPFVPHRWYDQAAPAATQAIFVKQGLPMVEAAWVLAVVVEVGGGLAMLFGLFTRPVGLVLAIWCVATALIAHSNIAERAQEIQFFKNMGLTGGFLYVTAFGAGEWSLDAWRSRRRDAVVAE